METKRVARRQHGKEFRAEVVQACRQAGASVAAIALRRGLNANVVYRWLREDAPPVQADACSRGAVSQRPDATFIAVQLPHLQPHLAVAPSTDIRIEVRRGPSNVIVSWPLEGAAACSAWLREWLR